MDSTYSKDETEVITPVAKTLLKSKDGKFSLFGFFMVTLMSIGRVVLHEVLNIIIYSTLPSVIHYFFHVHTKA